MSTFTSSMPLRGTAPSSTERLLLRAARGIEGYAIAHLARRAATTGAAAAQAGATERRRDALALGTVGIIPR